MFVLALISLLASGIHLFEDTLEEFSEFEEIEEVREVYVEVFYGEDNPTFALPKLASELQILLDRYVKKGSTVVDYVSKEEAVVQVLAHLVGANGKVVAFHSEPFKDLYEENIELVSPSPKKTLDDFELENVSLIKLEAQGRELLFLKGAEKTIARCRPVLIVSMLGGIPLELGDRFVKLEMEKRTEELRKMGYSVQKINEREFLAIAIGH